RSSARQRGGVDERDERGRKGPFKVSDAAHRRGGRPAATTGTPVVEHTLYAPDVVDAFLQVCQGREYVGERDGLREIHVPHCLVFTVQCRQPPCRRAEA